MDTCSDFDGVLSSLTTCSSIVSTLETCAYFNLESICCASCRALDTTLSENPSYAHEAFLFLAIIAAFSLLLALFALMWHSFPSEKHRFVPEKMNHLVAMTANIEITRGDFTLSTGHFSAESGNLNLLIGASGAGKSSNFQFLS